MNNIRKKFILNMDNKEARKFLLKRNNYFSLPIPSYFNLDYLIEYAIDKLKKDELSQKNHLIDVKKYSEIPDINYTIQINKTKNSYRPMVLIHPLLYVDYVNFLTKKENWDNIVERFNILRESVKNRIRCSSIPFDTEEKKLMNIAPLHFWSEVEQESIRLSLRYSYILHTDISNFYGSIYTHTIPWALHGEKEAKKNKNINDLIGNKLDKKIQHMNYGETVGIPQGNIVSDFIAELLLAYIDKLLVERLLEVDTTLDYKILRYRDDYRIFTNSKEDENIIKKELIVLLQRHKLSLGENKTLDSEDIINSSVKPDKLYWIEHDPVIKTSIDKIYTLPKNYFREETFNEIFHNRIYTATVQKHLFIIKILADKFPNSGQLTKALSEFEERIVDLNYDDFIKNGTSIEVLVSILLNIIKNNPKITVLGVKLLSILLNKIKYFQNFEEVVRIWNSGEIPKYDFEVKLELVNLTNKKLITKSINSYFEIWSQRLIIKVLSMENNFSINYINLSNEKLVKLANELILEDSSDVKLFNEEWIKEKYRIDWKKFIDAEEIDKLPDIITKNEIDFTEYIWNE